MANLHNRKSKCRLRSSPQFGLWFWCLSLQWFVTLPCIVGKCLGMDNLSLAVHPEGTKNVMYGQPLEIFCEDNVYKADNLTFKIGGNLLESTKVNETFRRLYIEHPMNGTFTYYCSNIFTHQNCPIRVLVDSPPSDVTDFACISKNLEVLNCTWSGSAGTVVTNHTLNFMYDGLSVTACHKRRERYCFWNTTSIPRYRQLEKKYYINLHFCNVFGCNEQNFTIDHYAAVKPDPPSNLKVVSIDTNSVLLQWNIPNNMVDLLPSGVDHRIEYQIAKIDDKSIFRKVDTTGLPPKNKTYKFLLSDLPYAHMQYDVRIYIRTKQAVKDEFWSDYTFIVFNTASERPKRPPDTAVGAFYQSSFANKRIINVYWKQLEEYEEAGANFTYKIAVYQESRNPKTLLANSTKSLSYVILDEASLGPVNVEIWSKNDKGSSLNSSRLYIPPYTDTEALRVLSFTKLAYENGTYRISWVGLKNIDNYTVFWCQHNTTNICTGRMDFTVLEPNKTNHIIDLPRENKYQFAISANSGMQTSGMVWATCDISKDGISMYGFPVEVKHEPAGKSSVKITWTMSCTLQEGIITGYNITYCPALNNISNQCDTKVGNKSTVYIPDPKKTEINITDLKPYTVYLFILSLNTTYGMKTLVNASTDVTTTEDTPTSPRNVKITDVRNNSVTVSWDTPLNKNGIIGKYVIYNYADEFVSYKVTKENDQRMSFTLKPLDVFSNYSWSIAACNTGIGSCSEKSPKNGIFVRTSIGRPSKLKSPTILNSPNMGVQWEAPEKPGGTLDIYQIKRVKDDQLEEIFNTTNLSYSLVHCEGGVGAEKYQVRAVNYDEELYHGALADRAEVQMPVENLEGRLEYFGEWSDPSTVACKSRDGLTMTYIIVAVFALAGIMYGSIKYYKKYRKMEDIKPVLPNGLGIPEKDIAKYAFGGWNQASKDEKPPSDEMLLLPNSRATTVSTDTKQKEENNCGASDHTDSTVLSDVSRGAVDRQASTSDEGSDSSLHLEEEAIRAEDNIEPLDNEDCSSSDTDPSAPYYTNEDFKINPASGYIQQPIVNPATGYVQSAPVTSPIAPLVPPQPATSSYVMAALSPPIFTTGVAPLGLQTDPPPSSGYVRPEEAQARSMLNFPHHKSSPTSVYGPESLPIMPSLPPASKHAASADSSYIQLQSLPSHKTVQNSAPPAGKGAASSGYVSPGDAVMHKHLSNMLSAGQLDEPAILDPAMSAAAYCRFSWSTDPANDNLHSLLANPTNFKSNNN